MFDNILCDCVTDACRSCEHGRDAGRRKKNIFLSWKVTRKNNRAVTLGSPAIRKQIQYWRSVDETNLFRKFNSFES